MLGNRLVERGQGLIVFGPAGCGKSVAALQACAEWAVGLAGLHIHPARALRIVVLQTEDSLNDYRETMAGILASGCFTEGKITLLKQNLIILPPVPGGTNVDLQNLLNAAALEHKPDLVMVNPMLAFCPGDPARELGGLLYQTIDPIIKRHQVGFFGVHHTAKTNNRDTTGYGQHDYQYLAAGDARVANWPRAMIQIEPMAKGVYRFRATKRWQRTCWTCEGQSTSERYFRHHDSEIRWIDATPEQAREAKAVEDYKRILEVLPKHDQPGICRDRIRVEAKQKLEIGKGKADSWLKLALEDGTVERMEVEPADNPGSGANEGTRPRRKEARFRRKVVANMP
ncbi:MAG: AAA family ATPase [Verrucomicrobiota bacterium]